MDYKQRRPVTKKFFNPFPKYLQLREILRKRMQSEFQIGDRLPTEEALCKEFDVSRETVREALRGLEQEGLIERHRAQGTFLLRRPEHTTEERLTGMSEDFTTMKLNTYSQILASGVVKSPAVARKMQVQTEEVFRITRLRYFDEKPLSLQIAYLPVEIGQRITNADVATTPITRILEGMFQIPCIEEKQEIEAMVADPELARHLQISVGAPVLFLTRFFRLLNATSLILFQAFYRADRYIYTLNIAEGLKK